MLWTCATCMHACVTTSTCMSVRRHMHARTHAHTHTHTHTCTHAHIHHTNTHIHTHACIMHACTDAKPSERGVSTAKEYVCEVARGPTSPDCNECRAPTCSTSARSNTAPLDPSTSSPSVCTFVTQGWRARMSVRGSCVSTGPCGQIQALQLVVVQLSRRRQLGAGAGPGGRTCRCVTRMR